MYVSFATSVKRNQDTVSDYFYVMQRLRGLLIITAVCENKGKVHVGVSTRQEGAFEMGKG